MSNLVPAELIENKIFLIRGQKVMLDFHLAGLYGVSTGRLNEQVRRNIDRFPEDFMFSLTREEISRISQIAISSNIKYSKNVNVFTEQGIAMLSSVLRSRRAIQVNIAIMRIFVKMKQIISTNKELSIKILQLEHKTEKHDKEIRAIFGAIRELMEPPPKKPKSRIGFQV